ncbi:MAG: AAA family ATPase [Proteobacteria bacterium]|nr:AAA family ATPase [Pseudomonadota bacterium]
MISLKDFMLNPKNYPERPKEIKYFETHISQVFVGDEYVYKIKKPVDFGFLNFTTLKRRQYYCNREVQLNRRLAKDLYLGVKKIYSDGKGFSFKKEKGAKVCEYAVYMRKINEEKILYNQILKGKLVSNIDKLAQTLYNFHISVPVYHGRDFGGVHSVSFNTQENFEQVSPYIGKTIDQETFGLIKDYTEKFIKYNKDLFKLRKDNGFVREVHGDLHSQHICMEKDIVIFDCIEFNNRFRISDILEDLAFLLMDLEYKGRYDLSKELKNHYFNQYQSAYDEELLNFYKIYRAYVRGKIEGFISESVTDSSLKEKIIKKAKDYFELARFYADKGTFNFNPLIFMGVSGSGKSTIANNFKDDFVILRSDEIRKEIAGIKKDEHQYVPYGEGIYSKEVSERTYNEMIKRAIKEGKKGKRVILDATFINPEGRLNTLSSLLREGFNPLFINFFASEETLRKRVKKRMEEDSDISDAHLEILEKQLRFSYQPDNLPSFRVMNINTEQNLADIVKGLKRLYDI